VNPGPTAISHHQETILTHSLRTIACAAALAVAIPGAARAEDLATYSITLKDHHFNPAEIHVPTGKPFFVVVTNASDAPDEFEMLIPALEKTLQPGQQGKVKIKPLGPGRFPFFGESDPDNEQGAFMSE
jgi:uncharacterized cupredoxin-like copper-binding protein